MVDISIIGAGPAGLTAAIYALQAGYKVNIFEKNVYGGQMAITNKIRNYPGLNEVSGVELSNNMYNQVSALGADFVFEEVKSVYLLDQQKIVITKSINSAIQIPDNKIFMKKFPL